MKKLSIVIPVFHSEKTLGSLVDQLISSLTEFSSLEILLVNDGSFLDNSATVCIGLAKKYEEIIYIELTKNFGEHNAVMAGLNYVTGDYVVIMDDDGQNPANEVEKLVSKLVQSSCDVIYAQYQQKKHSIFRNLGSRFNDIVATFLLKKPAGLYLASFKAMRSELVKNIIRYNGPYPYIDGLIFECTNRIDSVVVSHEERETGRSNYSFSKLVGLWLSMSINFSIAPLRIATFSGLFFSLISFLAGLAFFMEKVLGGTVPSGWTSLAVVVSFLGGIQLFTIGIVGEYLGRMLLMSNGRPQFVVRSISKLSGPL